MVNTTKENKEKICRFDLDWHEDEYESISEGICDECGEYSFDGVDCPRQSVDYGDKGTGPYFMCEACCAGDFSEEAAECLVHDCKIANEKFVNLNDKKPIFIDFLNELNKNYLNKDSIFKFKINNWESVIISLDKEYERQENLSPSKENIELFDAYYYGKYCVAFELNEQWFGIENDFVEFLRDVGFLVNECDILNRPRSSSIKTPVIRFTSPMGIYGYTYSFFIQENSLNFVEFHPYKIESIFEKEYRIPYFQYIGSFIFKDLEKALDKNTQYKLIRALALTQNIEKYKINQKTEILHFLSTYLDLAFTELYNRTFNENADNANSSLFKLIEKKITSKVHSKEKLNELRTELTKYKNESDFERKLLSLIYLDEIEIKGKKEDISDLNPQFADLLISILIRNFFAHKSYSPLILDDLNYKYCKIALFSSILTMYYIFIRNDYSKINNT